MFNKGRIKEKHLLVKAFVLVQT